MGFNRGGSSKYDGSNAAFKSAARSALAEPMTVTSPLNGITNALREAVVDIEEPIGAVWMHADLLADQAGVTINTDIILNQVHSQSNSGTRTTGRPGTSGFTPTILRYLGPSLPIPTQSAEPTSKPPSPRPQQFCARGR